MLFSAYLLIIWFYLTTLGRPKWLQMHHICVYAISVIYSKKINNNSESLSCDFCFIVVNDQFNMKLDKACCGENSLLD